MKKRSGVLVGSALVVALQVSVWAESGAGTAGNNRFQLNDVFSLEFASDPQISPDGRRVVYVRNFMDIMKDRRRSNLWIVSSDGSGHRPLTTGEENAFSPRWSPDGTRVLYVASSDGSSQLFVRWMDTGQTAKLTHLTSSPSGITWSPDGRWIAFSMLVREPSPPFVEMPAKPEGAEWAKPARVIRKLVYRADGQGYLRDGHGQLFILPAEGGTPRQVTSGPYNHEGTPSWAPDGSALVFSANRHPDWEYDPLNSEVYEVSLGDGAIRPLTDRQGPDLNPVVSPDGKRIAYLGFEDRQQGYQVTRLYVMDRDGGQSRLMARELDRDVRRPLWRQDGEGLYFQFDDQGNTRIGSLSPGGEMRTLATDLGGVSIGRPYSGGSFSVSTNGRFAYTQTDPQQPAEVAVGRVDASSGRRLTRLNDDLFGYPGFSGGKKLGAIEEIWFKSSFDGRRIQGWIVTPPDFDSAAKYPLILEIHGGPFANYGDRFSAEIQLYAAAGYVVLYTNPRGSTSYGQEFGNLIHHNYPGQDYDDLMSGVDAVIERGYVDKENLFVTGGSGGGVLSSWIVGKTHRFRAAVVAKPVINWYSFVLTSDAYNFFYKYWFSAFPWDDPQQYLKRSPLSLVGNVSTPTMLLTGEADYRTPISESEQFYQALKLRKVETVLVRIPAASHGITRRPSNLIAKVAHILKWFEGHRTGQE
ncbi:MAG: prolyl oligopeptidase family serine peptidase [Acidobacteriota bacterium]